MFSLSFVSRNFLILLLISSVACWLFRNVLFNLYTVEGFGVVNKAEIDVFLELSCFFDDPVDISNLTYGSSAFYTTSLNIWKFMVQVLLKPGLEKYEHYFNSV